MERYNKYLVLKIADIEKYLSDEKQLKLDALVTCIRVGRLNDGKRDQEYVCVAADWPMYEQVWGMVGAFVDGKPNEIEQLQAKVAELEAENELLKGRKNVELAANTDNAKSKQQRELAGPMEMGQLLAGSTHKTSGDLEIERTKPVTWIHKGGGFISDSRGKFIGCFSGDFRYRDRIICAINSESETSNQLAAEQLNNKLLRDALEFLNARIVTMDLGGVVERALSIPASTEALDKHVAEKVNKIESCRDWYKRRIDLLQEWQSKMRDPERTIVCDIIANGLTMPEGGRYEIDKSDLSTLTDAATPQ